MHKAATPFGYASYVYLLQGCLRTYLVNPTNGRQELVSIDVLNAGWSVPSYLAYSSLLKAIR